MTEVGDVDSFAGLAVEQPDLRPRGTRHKRVLARKGVTKVAGVKTALELYKAIP